MDEDQEVLEAYLRKAQTWKADRIEAFLQEHPRRGVQSAPSRCSSLVRWLPHGMERSAEIPPGCAHRAAAGCAHRAAAGCAKEKSQSQKGFKSALVCLDRLAHVPEAGGRMVVASH